jgi:hypothetical protein
MDGGSAEIAGANFYRPKAGILFFKKRKKRQTSYILINK